MKCNPNRFDLDGDVNDGCESKNCESGCDYKEAGCSQRYKVNTGSFTVNTGSPAILNCENVGLVGRVNLSIPSSVRTIYFGSGPFLQPFVAYPQYQYDHNVITSVDVNSLVAQAPNIKSIDLQGNNMSVISRFEFDPFLSLTELIIGGNPAASSSVQCPPLYFRTVVLKGGVSYRACDLCTRPLHVKKIFSFTCWGDPESYNFLESHHPPRICASGHYCDFDTLNEIPCPVGTANYLSGSNSIESCTPCEAGSYNPVVGMAFCPFQCAPGTFSTSIGATNVSFCVKCTPGHYCSSHGTSVPEPCPAGTFSFKEGALKLSACVKCPANHYSDNLGQTLQSSCKTCESADSARPLSPSGSSSVLLCTSLADACSRSQYIKNKICVGCPDGHYCDGVYAKVCPLGHYCFDAIMNACPEGTASPNLQMISEDACKPCEAGSYSGLTGQAICLLSCPSGTYMDPTFSGAKQVGDCLECLEGHFCSQRGTIVPEKCPAGTYRKEKGANKVTDCFLCPENTFSSVLGQTSSTTCLSCPSSTISPKGSSSKNQCIVSVYTCKEGKGWRVRVATTATTSSQEEKICEPCPKGSFGVDSRSCQLCPAGSFQNMIGMSACERCGPGIVCEKLPGSTTNGGVDFNELIEFDRTVLNITQTIIKEKNLGMLKKQSNSIGIIVLYALLAVVAASVFFSHRYFPISFKRFDLLFSQKHIIDDEHALRTVDSRLGAAFTGIFAIIVIGLFIDTVSDPNDQTLSTMELMTQKRYNKFASAVQSSHGKNNFGDVNVQADLFSQTILTTCSELILPLISGNNTVLGCNKVQTVMVPQIDGMHCRLSWVCKVPLIISGIPSIYFRATSDFQTMKWSVSSESWSYWNDDGNRFKSKIVSTLTPTTGWALCGTESDPTDIVLRMNRGFASVQHSYQNYTTAGLLLEWENNAVKECRTTSKEDHVIGFRFAIAPLVNMESTTAKLKDQDRVSLLLALISSALAVLGIMKMVLGTALDYYFMSKPDPPHDVLRRHRLLAESNLNRAKRRPAQIQMRQFTPNETAVNVEVMGNGDIFHTNPNTVVNPIASL